MIWGDISLAHHLLAGLSVDDGVTLKVIVLNPPHRITRVVANLPNLIVFDEWAIRHLWCLVDDRMLLSIIVYHDVVDVLVETRNIEVGLMESHTIHCRFHFLYTEFNLVDQRVICWLLVEIGIVVRPALG